MATTSRYISFVDIMATLSTSILIVAIMVGTASMISQAPHPSCMAGRGKRLRVEKELETTIDEPKNRV